MALFRTIVTKISIKPDQKVKQKDYLERGQFPVVDQGKNTIGGFSDDEKKVINCELPVIVFGDHTRSVKFINFPFIAGADGIKVVKPNENVLPNFLYYGTQYLVAKMPDKGYARHYQLILSQPVRLYRQ